MPSQLPLPLTAPVGIWRAIINADDPELSPPEPRTGLYGLRFLDKSRQANTAGRLSGWLRRPKRRRMILAAGIVLVLILAAGVTGSLYLLRHDADRTTLAGVTKSVGRHYLLPTDEGPALATVVDKRKVSSPFFKQAENGDRILIYQRHQLAIIYRPSIDRIVAVGPVDIDTPKNGTP